MPLPLRSLTVLQNWDCHGCSDCCRTYHVRVTFEEKDRIDQQGWEHDPAVNDTEWVVYDRKSGGYRLNHRPGGMCVFLDENQQCRIHAKFGSAGKPLACRLYPFVLVPVGDHWRVGLRYACPSSAGNLGRPLAEHREELTAYARQVEGERTNAELATVPPPLQAGQSVPWPDLLRFVTVLVKLLDGPGSLEQRLRGMHALAVECRGARFEKITGQRLTEFLDLLAPALMEDLPPASKVRQPGWVGRVMFRQLAALYARKDLGKDRGQMADRGAWGRARAAWRFARGTGMIPPVHAFIPAVSFTEAEQPLPPLSPQANQTLERYYRLKLESVQFCGSPNFHLSFWDGLDSLLLTYPVILWLTRILTVAERNQDEAVVLAMRIVDDNFGFNPLLGSRRQQIALRMMNIKQEIPRLIAWYARTK